MGISVRKNNRGLSLIELMVVLAIAGIVITGLGSLMVNTLKSNNVARIGQEISSLVSEIQVQVSYRDGCREAFSVSTPQNFNYTLASTSSTSSSSGTSSQQGQDVQLNLPNNRSVVGGANVPGYNLMVNALQIYDAQNIGTSGVNTVYSANLLGRFQTDAEVSGPQQFTRPLTSITLVVNPANQIIDCLPKDSFDEVRTCEYLGGSYNYSTLQCEGCSFMACSGCSGGGKPVWETMSTFGESYTSACPSGYSGSGTTSTCQSNGTWSTATNCTQNNSGGSNQGGSCFTAGSLVSMFDGTLKRIEEIQPGDLVFGKFGINRVKQRVIVDLGARSLFSINGGPFFASEEHAFYSKNKGWVALNLELAAEELPTEVIRPMTIGTKLERDDGSFYEIETIDLMKPDQNIMIYTLSVDNDNTFYVNGFLVHNQAGGCGWQN